MSSLCSINRSRSMRKLAQLLFEVEEDESDSEGSVSTHCDTSDPEVPCFTRCCSEESIPPFHSLAQEAERKDTGNAPGIPAAFLGRRGPLEGLVIAVGRDGVGRWTAPAVERCLEWLSEPDEPLIAVSRDGTCRFSPADGQHAGEALAHAGYLNYLSFNPLEVQERRSVVLVSPAGEAFPFGSWDAVDWSRIEARTC